VRTIFGDAAAATLVSAVDSPDPLIGPFIYGTDGSGGPNLIVPAGGARCPRTAETAVAAEEGGGNRRSRNDVFMNGAEIFNFTIDVIPQTVDGLLRKAELGLEDVDLFVFHQANKYMLEHLRKRLRIPQEKFQTTMSHCGNTVSSTIPIALKHAAVERSLPKGARVMLVGFGVGYSWGATLARWSGLYGCPGE
jgi:3-oxoacyl-[acyl-carrier-protein] synthase-3